MTTPTIADIQFTLPPAPVVLQKLSKTLDLDDSSSAEVAAVLETDQACTARLLRVVNSPFYGFTRRVTSVAEAITMLGLQVVHDLFLTTSVFNAYRIDGDKDYLAGFWKHSFAVGVIAKHIATTQKFNLGDRGFIAGILHDIGRLALAKADIGKFREVYSDGGAVVDLEDEKRMFGVDHQTLGKLLAEKWNFPEELTEVIGRHHTPETISDPSIVLCSVILADLICHALGLGNNGVHYVSRFSPMVVERLALPIERLEEVVCVSLAEIEEAGSLFTEGRS